MGWGEGGGAAEKGTNQPFSYEISTFQSTY